MADNARKARKNGTRRKQQRRSRAGRQPRPGRYPSALAQALAAAGLQGLTPGQGGLKHVITGLDGTPSDGLHDDCPLCMDLRLSGGEAFTIDPAGNGLVPIPGDLTPRPMAVTIDADDHVRKVIGAVPRSIEVPTGTSVLGLTLYLELLYPMLFDAFPQGILATDPCGGPDGVLAPGATVLLSSPDAPRVAPD